MQLPAILVKPTIPEVQEYTKEQEECKICSGPIDIFTTPTQKKDNEYKEELICSQCSAFNGEGKHIMQ